MFVHIVLEKQIARGGASEGLQEELHFAMRKMLPEENQNSQKLTQVVNHCSTLLQDRLAQAPHGLQRPGLVGLRLNGQRPRRNRAAQEISEAQCKADKLDIRQAPAALHQRFDVLGAALFPTVP